MDTECKSVGYFANRERLETELANYYSPFNLKMVMSMVDSSTPFSLLNIFLLDKPFSGDFHADDEYLVILNSEIYQYLEAIVVSMKNDTFELDLDSIPNKGVPFTYTPSIKNKSGQGKLLFVTSLFELAQPNLVSYTHAGSGEGATSINQLEAKKISGFEGVVNCYDPLSDAESHVTDGVRYEKKRESIYSNSTFSEPVLFDIYHTGTWQNIQSTSTAPFKSMKIPMSLKVDCPTVSCPYHTESRTYSTPIRLFHHVLSPTVVDGFDDCSDCLKWKALILEYDLEPGIVLSSLIRCGVRPCVPVPGFQTVETIMSKDKSLVIEETLLFTALAVHDTKPKESFPKLVSPYASAVLSLCKRNNLFVKDWQMDDGFMFSKYYPKYVSVTGLLVSYSSVFGGIFIDRRKLGVAESDVVIDREFAVDTYVFYFVVQNTLLHRHQFVNINDGSSCVTVDSHLLVKYAVVNPYMAVLKGDSFIVGVHSSTAKNDYRFAKKILGSEHIEKSILFTLLCSRESNFSSITDSCLSVIMLCVVAFFAGRIDFSESPRIILHLPHSIMCYLNIQSGYLNYASANVGDTHFSLTQLVARLS